MNKPPSRKTPSVRRPARERLLAAAEELFYQDGVQSVGIDRVIERAGVAKASLYANFNGKDDLVRAYLDARFEARRAAIEMSRPRTRARHIRWRRQLHGRRHTDREADDHIFGVGLVNDCSRATVRPGNTNLPGFPFKELRNDDLAVDRVSAQSFLVDAGLTTHSVTYRPSMSSWMRRGSRSSQSICRRASMVPSLRPFIPNERAAFAASGPKAWLNG